MYHPTHITLVDAHTEGDGCTDDTRTVGYEGFLHCFPVLRLHARMVGGGSKAETLELGGEHLGVGPSLAIDDTALTRAVLYEADDGPNLFFLVQALLYGEGKVRAVEG